MRVILILLLFLPVVTRAQINRSASELARDNVRDYLVTKIFKSQSYRPGFYGELKPYSEKNTGAFWMIEHQFEIAEPKTADNTDTLVPKPYKFVFYMDRRMTIIKAHAAYLE